MLNLSFSTLSFSNSPSYSLLLTFSFLLSPSYSLLLKSLFLTLSFLLSPSYSPAFPQYNSAGVCWFFEILTRCCRSSMRAEVWDSLWLGFRNIILLAGLSGCGWFGSMAQQSMRGEDWGGVLARFPQYKSSTVVTRRWCCGAGDAVLVLWCWRRDAGDAVVVVWWRRGGGDAW